MLYGLWGFHFIRGEYKLAISAAEQMEALGQTRGDDTALMLGHVYHAITRYCLAEFATSVVLLNKCHDLSEPSHREACAGLTAEDPYVMALSWLALTLTTLGYADQGRERIAEVHFNGSPAANNPIHVVSRWYLHVGCLVNRAALDEKRYADELIALSMEHNFFYLLSFGHFHRGFALTELGQPREGLDAMAQSLSMFQAIGAVCCKPWIFVVQADAYAKLDQPQDAFTSLANAAQIIGSTDERFVEPELHRIRGELLVRAGDTVAAEHNYHLALAEAQRQSSKLYELRAAASLARLWLDQGKRVEARELSLRSTAGSPKGSTRAT